MADNNEKERRKKLMQELRKKAEEEFTNSLPMSRYIFNKLFDYLDKELGDKECDDTNKLAKYFLSQNSISNSDQVLAWLAEQGGHCDCEILANVEERFEQ